MLAQLLPFLTASIILTMSPGPDIIYVLLQGMVNGKKYGLVTGLGLAAGIIVHTSLVAFGISAVIKESEILFLVIKIFGALYLLYLAYKVYRSDAKITLGTENVQKKALILLFKRGFLMNVMNPKVSIFFLAFFPAFLWDPTENTVLQFYILGGIFMLQAILIFALVAVSAGKISSYLKKYKHSGLVLKWLQILAFLGITVFILL